MSTTKYRTPLDTKTRHGIPVPTVEPNSLRDAVIALRSAMEEITRQRGDMLDSALTVKDLVKLGVISPESVELLDKGGAYYRLQAVAGMSQAHQGFGALGSSATTGGGNAFNPDQFDLDWLLNAITGDHLSDELANIIGQIPGFEQIIQDGLSNAQKQINHLQTQVDADVANLVTEVAARQLDVSNLQTQVNDLAGSIAADVWVQPEPPVPGVGGVPDPLPDFARWYDSDDNNHPYVWDGIQWVSIQDPRIAQNAVDITALQVSLTDAEGDILANSTALSTLDSTVANLGLTVTAQGSSITTLQSSVTQAEFNIDGNALAISGLTTRVTAAEGSITSQSASIVALQSDVTSLDGATTANADAIGGLETRVTAAEGSITAFASDISSLQSGLTTANGNISANSTAIGGLDTRVTAAEGTITAQSSDITALQTGLSTAQGDITANSSALGSLDTRVTAAEGTITAQSSDITALQSGLTSANTNIGANSTAIGGLDTRVTSAEGTITAQAGDITALQTTVGTLDGDVTALSSAVSTLDSRVTTAENTVSSFASSIVALEADVADLQLNDYLETQVSGNASAIQGLEAQVVMVEGEISTMASDISNLQASVALLEGGTAALDAIAALTVRVDANELGIAANASDIVSLQGELTNLDSTVDLNASAISALDIRLTSAEGVNTSQASDITSLQSGLALKVTTFAQGTQPVAAAVGDIWIHTGDGNTMWRWNGTSWVQVNNATIGANASAITALDTRVDATESSITAQAGQISTLSSDLTNLQGTVGGQATAISGLTTRVTDAEGDITAQASQLTSLSTTVGGHTTSISTLTSTTNGLSAQYTVKVDNNGYVAGFGLASTPINGVPVSTFTVLADNFLIANPGFPNIVPFLVTGGVAYMQNVVIGDAVIDNLQVNKVTSGTIGYPWTLGDSLTLNASGHIKGGQTAYATGTGFFLGYSSGAYRFSIGSSTRYLRWTGSALELRGSIIAESGSSMDYSYVGGTKPPADADKTKTIIDGGLVTTGSIVLSTSGHIRSGQTAYATGTGFFLGNDAGTPKFSIGDSTKYMRWDGSGLLLKGNVELANGFINPAGFKIQSTTVGNTCPPVLYDHGVDTSTSGNTSYIARTVTIAGTGTGTGYTGFVSPSFTAPAANNGFHHKRFAFHKMDVYLKTNGSVATNYQTWAWKYRTHNGTTWGAWTNIITHSFDGGGGRTYSPIVRFTTPASGWTQIEFEVSVPNNCSYLQLEVTVQNWNESPNTALSSSSLYTYVPPPPWDPPPGYIIP